MKKIVKTTFFALCVPLLFAACNAGENEFGRIDQKADVPIPEPVTVASVRNISGGAVIKVNIPDDDNIKGIIATYTRGGKEVNTKISRYTDSLLIVGYADTLTHKVELASFNVNEERSSSVTADFRPLPPAILLATPQLFQAFGGVKIRIEGNTPKADLAVCLLRDEDLNDFDKPVGQMKWVEVQTLFTAADSITLSRRGLAPVEAIYGVYLRDRWGNCSDTAKVTITPLEEVKLPADKFRNANLGDDNLRVTNRLYPIEALWDGTGTSEKTGGAYHFFYGEGPRPSWFTIDLGVKAKLSRVATLPRINYQIWSIGHPRNFEFWGSLNPTGQEVPGNEHGFDDTWFCLGKFQQFKPSGYEPDGMVGTVTQDDREYFNNGNDFELNNEVFPHAYDELRYLRVVIVETFASFENNTPDLAVHLGEVTPWGQIIQAY